MGDPAGNARDREQRCEEVLRDAQHGVGEAGVVVDVGADRLSSVLHDRLLDHFLKGGVEFVSLRAALLIGEGLAQAAKKLAAGIAESVDGVSETVYET